jgi:hypothetical protein
MHYTSMGLFMSKEAAKATSLPKIEAAYVKPELRRTGQSPAACSSNFMACPSAVVVHSLILLHLPLWYLYDTCLKPMSPASKNPNTVPDPPYLPNQSTLSMTSCLSTVLLTACFCGPHHSAHNHSMALAKPNQLNIPSRQRSEDHHSPVTAQS